MTTKIIKITICYIWISILSILLSIAKLFNIHFLNNLSWYIVLFPIYCIPVFIFYCIPIIFIVLYCVTTVYKKIKFAIDDILYMIRGMK